jgi:transposase
MILLLLFKLQAGAQMMKKFKVTLTKDERNELETITRKGSHRSIKVLNALILLACDEGEFQDSRSKSEQIAAVLNVSLKKIERVKKRFVEESFEVALHGHKGKRIYERKADGDFEAHLVALSCSKPPDGFGRWSLRMLADKVVELNYIDSVSYETVRRVLKKTKLSPGKNKAG